MVKKFLSDIDLSLSLMCVYCQSNKISEQPCSTGETEDIQYCGKKYELFTNWYSGSNITGHGIS
jgi:hypothetical protein